MNEIDNNINSLYSSDPYIRTPDNAFMDMLIQDDNNQNIDESENDFDMSELQNSFDMLEINDAIQKSIIQYEKEKIYSTQIEDLRIKMHQNNIYNNRKIDNTENLKKNRLEISRDFEKNIMYSPLNCDQLKELKSSLNDFKVLKSNNIIVSYNTYISLYEFINSGKHRFTEKYIDSFINKYIDYHTNDENDEYVYEDC
jgi:Icc-related predicted phosphoesterase